jgi:Immunoglobulin I-set domain
LTVIRLQLYYRLIADKTKYSLEKNGLRIHNVQPEDGGVYECRAEVASQGNLKVQTINLDVICELCFMDELLYILCQ